MGPLHPRLTRFLPVLAYIGFNEGATMAAPKVISHWRDSGRNPRFFGIDARSTFPLLFFLVHIKLWTFIVTVIITLLFGIIGRYGFSTAVFLRMIRSLLAGSRKFAKPWWREDKMQ